MAHEPGKIGKGRRTSERDWEVPLFDVRIRDQEIEAVAEVYRSGWLSMGPRTEELEAAFAAYTGARHAVALSSGTAALHLALLGSGVAAGDAVVMPSLTFVATANAAAYAGAKPDFAEIAGLARPWLSAEVAEGALEAGASAIVNVAYGGHLGETAELASLAERHGVPLIEDAAHASGSWGEGRHAGTFGAAGALSFFSNKNLGIGEGGILLTDEDRLAEQARSLRSHGLSSSAWERHQDLAGSYQVGELGFNYRLDEPRAALARLRLDRLDEENRRRAAIDAEYRDALASLSGLSLVGRPIAGERRSCHLFPVVLDDELDRDAFRRALGTRGVQTSVHYPPVHSFELYARGGFELPLTEAYAERTVSLPIFPDMEPWQRELVVEAVGAGLAEAGGGR